MTSSLDWAGLVSAVTATAQAVAVMVQVYWDRRQRGTRTTEHDDCRRVPRYGKASLPEARVVRVQVSVGAHARTPVTLVVLVDGNADGADLSSPSVKGYRPW
ncbi:hypothetical protein SUDANB15_07284 [Streptomyces sp. enrichment culture]|uniref:hypothetical protein n=1 Tax=Streptomyces griseomycini TaxID=66895 RepID=UPI0034439ABA